MIVAVVRFTDAYRHASACKTRNTEPSPPPPPVNYLTVMKFWQFNDFRHKESAETANVIATKVGCQEASKSLGKKGKVVDDSPDGSFYTSRQLLCCIITYQRVNSYIFFDWYVFFLSILSLFSVYYTLHLSPHPHQDDSFCRGSCHPPTPLHSTLSRDTCFLRRLRCLMKASLLLRKLGVDSRLISLSELITAAFHHAACLYSEPVSWQEPLWSLGLQMRRVVPKLPRIGCSP